jgi:hypothetical protein
VNVPFTFDEEKHEYRIEDKILPSVTKILSATGVSRDYSGISPIYAKRGIAIHKAVELVDKGTLDESSLIREITPQVRGYKRFVADTGYQPLHCELRLIHRALWYAGGIDKVGRIDGKLGIIDIKATESVDNESLKAQLIGYKILWEKNYPEQPIDFLYGLKLRRDGRPNLITRFTSTPKSHWLDILDRYLLLTL